MQNVARQYSKTADEELVTLAREGDSAAFAELTERHYASAVRLAATILRNRDDAEDETQNAFTKAFEHIGRFEGGCRFSTWLTRIVVNQCLMRLRQSRRSRVVHINDMQPVDSNAPAWEPADTGAAPDQYVGSEQLRKVLEMEIRRIPPLLRQPFLLRHVESLPMPEVAERLGISVAAAKSRLLRARRELQLRLERHQGRLGPATLTA